MSLPVNGKILGQNSLVNTIKKKQRKFRLQGNRRKTTSVGRESEECPEACWYTVASEEPVYKCRHRSWLVFAEWMSTRQRGQKEDQLPWWNINLAICTSCRNSFVLGDRWMKLSTTCRHRFYSKYPIPRRKIFITPVNYKLANSLHPSQFHQRSKKNSTNWLWKV